VASIPQTFKFRYYCTILAQRPNLYCRTKSNKHGLVRNYSLDGTHIVTDSSDKVRPWACGILQGRLCRGTLLIRPPRARRSLPGSQPDYRCTFAHHSPGDLAGAHSYTPGMDCTSRLRITCDSLIHRCIIMQLARRGSIN
jgi:hypothetical protein